MKFEVTTSNGDYVIATCATQQEAIDRAKLLVENGVLCGAVVYRGQTRLCAIEAGIDGEAGITTASPDPALPTAQLI